MTALPKAVCIAPKPNSADPASPFQIFSAWTPAQLAAEVDGMEARDQAGVARGIASCQLNQIEDLDARLSANRR